MIVNWQDVVFIDGIDVEYNGKESILLLSDERRKYAIGEMVCELTRFDVATIKSIIMRVPGYKEVPNRKKMLKAVGWLRLEMKEVLTPVICEMVFVEFVNSVRDFYLEESAEYMQECIMNLDSLYRSSEIEYAFEGSEYNEPGAESVGQLFLTMLLGVALEYKLAMNIFNGFINADDVGSGQKRAYQILRMSKKDSYLQDIQYKILFYDDRFNSVFRIKTMMSLCLFEMAHIYEKNILISKCKNCSHYFVPLKRSDTRYCNYPAPDNPDRTCKEIGAQNTWANKEKTDDVTRAYRTVYMRNKMRANRHPDDEGAQKRLAQLTEGIRDWRHRLASGEAEKDEFIKWLEEF